MTLSFEIFNPDTAGLVCRVYRCCLTACMMTLSTFVNKYDLGFSAVGWTGKDNGNRESRDKEKAGQVKQKWRRYVTQRYLIYRKMLSCPERSR
jgi:hypothetical protein